MTSYKLRSASRVLHIVACLIGASFLKFYSHADTEHASWSVKQLVEYHQQLHENFTVQDAFKLFYQASFGVEHILGDSSAAFSYLMDELSKVDTLSPKEPLLERISLDDSLVRVNLRPFKTLNLEPSLLVKVMFQSARETLHDTLMFFRMWNEFAALVKYGLLTFPLDSIDVMSARLEEGIMAPLHHSQGYVSSNRPAYRVVRRSLFEEVFGRK